MVIAGLNCYDRTLDTPNKSLNLKLSLWRNLRTRCAFESDGVCWKPNPYLEFFVSASPLLYKKRRSHISLFPSQLFLPFFWYIFVLKTLAWRGKKQSDIRDRREAGKFCVKRRRKWDTQRFGTRIPRALGLAPAPAGCAGTVMAWFANMGLTHAGSVSVSTLRILALWSTAKVSNM
jgi:hypothetical protein